MESHVSDFGRGWYSHAPDANTAAEVTLSAPGARQNWVIDTILFGVDKDPAAALELTVTIDTKVVLTVPLAQKCVGQFDFPERMLEGGTNEAIAVAISADSGGASAYLNVSGHTNYSS